MFSPDEAQTVEIVFEFFGFRPPSRRAVVIRGFVSLGGQHRRSMPNPLSGGDG
jgi:hypothetical protein